MLRNFVYVGLVLIVVGVIGVLGYKYWRITRLTPSAVYEVNTRGNTPSRIGSQFTDTNGFSHNFGVESVQNMFDTNFILNGRWIYGKLKDYTFDTASGAYKIKMLGVNSQFGDEFTFVLPVAKRKYALSVGSKSSMEVANELEPYLAKGKLSPIGVRVGVYVETPFGYPAECVDICKAYIDEVRANGKDFDTKFQEYYGVMWIDFGNQ